MFPRSFGLETDLFRRKVMKQNEAGIRRMRFLASSSSTLGAERETRAFFYSDSSWERNELGNMASSNNHDFDE